jgi:hypothetical protein
MEIVVLFLYGSVSKANEISCPFKAHLLCKPGYVILCVGFIMEGRSLCVFEFPISVCLLKCLENVIW